MSSYDVDRQFSGEHRVALQRIIQRCAGSILTLEIEEASDEDDRKHATDYYIKAEIGRFGCRIRREDCGYRDLTIRSSRYDPTIGRWFADEVELAKILGGEVDWMVYGWTRAAEVTEWMVIDLRKVVARRLHTNRPEISNHADANERNSRFIAIPVVDLIRAGPDVLVDVEIHWPTLITHRGWLDQDAKRPIGPFKRTACPRCGNVAFSWAKGREGAWRCCDGPRGCSLIFNARTKEMAL